MSVRVNLTLMATFDIVETYVFIFYKYENSRSCGLNSYTLPFYLYIVVLLKCLSYSVLWACCGLVQALILSAGYPLPYVIQNQKVLSETEIL